MSYDTRLLFKADMIFKVQVVIATFHSICKSIERLTYIIFDSFCIRSEHLAMGPTSMELHFCEFRVPLRSEDKNN